jgi:hypothetical protein
MASADSITQQNHVHCLPSKADRLVSCQVLGPVCCGCCCSLVCSCSTAGGVNRQALVPVVEMQVLHNLQAAYQHL